MALSKVKFDESGIPSRTKYRIVVLGKLDPHDWKTSDCFAPSSDLLKCAYSSPSQHKRNPPLPGPVILSFLAVLSMVAILATVVAFVVEGESGHGHLIFILPGIPVITMAQRAVAQVMPLQDPFFKMIDVDILHLEVNNLFNTAQGRCYHL